MRKLPQDNREGERDVQKLATFQEEHGPTSREEDSPTTYNTESGAECRSADAFEHESKDIGNPDGRIPEHLPKRSREEEIITEAGNPDIWVPDRLKREDGLRAHRALETENAEEGEERGDETREVDGRRTPMEVQTSTGLEDTATGQDSPKERQSRHVLGGTWLS
ncbi:hypothetical protein NDU88_003190 [Pleurodeles waltl]|uniref:Uncharacterized protein n=1 Tax=Pleurodeles waltl TaxID=8319 RepID=A0AAV7Q8A9_PLEWA|nr:hypothetical protein NDU88_003190 [Pleurodeles waltl]